MSTKQTILQKFKDAGYTGDAQLVNVQAWLKEKEFDTDKVEIDGKEFVIADVFTERKAFSFKSDADTKARDVGRVTSSISEDGEIKVLGTYQERAREEYNHKAKQGKTVFANANNAELFGMWYKNALCSVSPRGLTYPEREKDRQTLTKALGDFPLIDGGILVPRDFEPTLIRLVLSYGVARGAIGTTPMMNFTKDIPRRIAGITGAWVAEGGTATASTPQYDLINLVAKKRMTFSQASNEIIHDSALSIADQVSTEIAQDFAKSEDEAAFLGDGTSTYGGFIGITYKYRTIHEANGGTWGTNNDYCAGLVVASGNLYSEFTKNDILAAIGKLPDYVWKNGNPKIYMHESVYWNVIEPMALTPASSGNSYELINGKPTYRVRGLPVEFTNVLPATDANSQIGILVGDLSMGAKFGVVNNQMAIASSEHYGFNTDSIYFRGTQRVAVKVHDVGNWSATASARLPGPIVGICSANS